MKKESQVGGKGSEKKGEDGKLKYLHFKSVTVTKVNFYNMYEETHFLMDDILLFKFISKHVDIVEK